MCYIWQNPTEPKEEVSIETLAKLPGGFDNLNVSGGEPTLRKDLADMVDLLRPKARILEISSNGLHPERLLPIVRKHPDVKIRFSLEGDPATSNSIRGEKDGYATKVAGLRMLQEAGGRIWDLPSSSRTRTWPNSCGPMSWRVPWGSSSRRRRAAQRLAVLQERQPLLQSRRRGAAGGGAHHRHAQEQQAEELVPRLSEPGPDQEILGQPRLIPCTAGTDFAFIDPWSDVWACDVRSDLPMGNLAEAVLGRDRGDHAANASGARSARLRTELLDGDHRAHRDALDGHPAGAEAGTAGLGVEEQAEIALGRPICFDAYIDYSNVLPTPRVPRTSFLEDKTKGHLVRGITPSTPDTRSSYSVNRKPRPAKSRNGKVFVLTRFILASLKTYWRAR